MRPLSLEITAAARAELDQLPVGAAQYVQEHLSALAQVLASLPSAAHGGERSFQFGAYRVLFEADRARGAVIVHQVAAVSGAPRLTGSGV